MIFLGYSPRIPGPHGSILRADPDACFVLNRHEMIPLQVAAMEGRSKVIRALVNASKATAFVLTDKGEPILHLCAKNNRFKALKELVKWVDDDDFLKLTDRNDDTILHVLSAKSRTLVWISTCSKSAYFSALVKMNGICSCHICSNFISIGIRPFIRILSTCSHNVISHFSQSYSIRNDSYQTKFESISMEGMSSF